MIIPVLVVTAIGYTISRAVKRPAKVGMTAKRMKIYQSALVTLKDPEKLKSLADAYEREGLIAESIVLRKRAALRALPKEMKKRRREVFRKAIQSSNPEAVSKVADAYAAEGCTIAARSLRQHADSLIHEAELLKVFSEDVTNYKPLQSIPPPTPVVAGDDEPPLQEEDVDDSDPDDDRENDGE